MTTAGPIRSSTAAKNGRASLAASRATQDKTSMSTSPRTFALSRPADATPIPDPSLAYLRTRNRLRIFELVQKAFDRSGLTKAALAARLKKDGGQLNRLLGAPGNWTLDTVSDLLFAICGGVPQYSIAYPLDRPARNATRIAATDNVPADLGGDGRTEARVGPDRSAAAGSTYQYRNAERRRAYMADLMRRKRAAK